MKRIQYKSILLDEPLSTEGLNEYVSRGYTLLTAVSCLVPSNSSTSRTPKIQYIFYKEILIPKKY